MDEDGSSGEGEESPVEARLRAEVNDETHAMPPSSPASCGHDIHAAEKSGDTSSSPAFHVMTGRDLCRDTVDVCRRGNGRRRQGTRLQPYRGWQSQHSPNARPSRCDRVACSGGRSHAPCLSRELEILRDARARPRRKGGNRGESDVHRNRGPRSGRARRLDVNVDTATSARLRGSNARQRVDMRSSDARSSPLVAAMREAPLASPRVPRLRHPACPKAAARDARNGRRTRPSSGARRRSDVLCSAATRGIVGGALAVLHERPSASGRKRLIEINHA